MKANWMYNKLFSKIVDSSIWMEPDHVRLIWMMFIAIMDEDGFVNLASVKNVAHRAVMDLDKAENAIEVLESPDPDSSNPDHEGRRLTRAPGGWMVNNAKEYREIVKREHQKELNRERVRKHRSRACNGAVMVANENVTTSEAYTEADTDTKTEVNTKAGKPAAIYSTDFLEFWKYYPPGRKQDKGKAYKAWSDALKLADAETIIEAAKEYAASDVGRGEFVKGPAPWLNGRCWDDARAAWADARQQPQSKGAAQVASNRKALTEVHERIKNGTVRDLFGVFGHVGGSVCPRGDAADDGGVHGSAARLE